MTRHIHLTDDEWDLTPNEARARRAQIIARVRKLLDAVSPVLTPRQRDILERRYWHGETQEHIAQTLGISQPTVWKHLQRAKAKIMDNLGAGL